MDIDSKTKKLTFAALSAAAIFALTYFIPVPIPGSGGYLNIGDAPIYLAAYLLGGPLAALAGGIGAGLSDIALGYAYYALPTAIIKALMALTCAALAKTGDMRRFIFAAVVSGAVMVAGYGLFEGLMFNANQALAVSAMNAVQWVVGVLVAAALFPAVRRLRREPKYANMFEKRDSNKA